MNTYYEYLKIWYINYTVLKTDAPHNKETSMKTILSIILILSFLILSGCGASKSPVLYPNHHLNTVGREVAQADIDDCMQQAYSGANEGKGERLPRRRLQLVSSGLRQGR